MCNTFLSVNKPCGPSAEYLKVLPAIEIASIYALTTGGKERFHIGVTNTYLSALKNSSKMSLILETFISSSSVNVSPLLIFPQPVNTSLSITGI